MTVVISVVVSLCGNVSMAEVKQKMAELERQNPGAKVTLRLDKKCK
jgi:hypothetical protein